MTSEGQNSSQYFNECLEGVNKNALSSDADLQMLEPPSFGSPAAEEASQCYGTNDCSNLGLENFFAPISMSANEAMSDCVSQSVTATKAPPSPSDTDTGSILSSPLVAADVDAASPVDDRPPENVSLRAKRAKRLQDFLETFRHAPTPSIDSNNSTVLELHRAAAVGLAKSPYPTPARLASALEALSGDAGSIRAFVYGILSWEVFRREEERMSCARRLSTITASKAANKQMVETLHRRAKTRDWARDGRKAAKVVFDTLQSHQPSVRSTALLLLASTTSLDGMLKIAHFPITRAGFAASFAQIVESKAARWKDLTCQGYRAFDYEQILRSKWLTLGDEVTT